MFTVNEKVRANIDVQLEFQNISCLRLIIKGEIPEFVDI